MSKTWNYVIYYFTFRVGYNEIFLICCEVYLFSKPNYLTSLVLSYLEKKNITLRQTYCPESNPKIKPQLTVKARVQAKNPFLPLIIYFQSISRVERCRKIVIKDGIKKLGISPAEINFLFARGRNTTANLRQ